MTRLYIANGDEDLFNEINNALEDAFLEYDIDDGGRYLVDEDDVDDSIVFIYVSYLREKLEAVQADVEIVGERGQDYVLTLKEASAEV